MAMQQFEKWNKETNIEPNAVFYLNRKEGWKAALKWALEQDTWIGSDEDGEWGIDKDEIKGELRGEES